MKDPIADLRRIAQAAAERVHELTGVPFVIVLLSDASDLSVLGAWVPSAKLAAEIMRNAVASIDDQTAQIIDNRPKGQRGGST